MNRPNWTRIAGTLAVPVVLAGSLAALGPALTAAHYDGLDWPSTTRAVTVEVRDGVQLHVETGDRVRLEYTGRTQYAGVELTQAGDGTAKLACVQPTPISTCVLHATLIVPPTTTVTIRRAPGSNVLNQPTPRIRIIDVG